ncbi:MAG: hypothetical protein E6Q60_07575 [Nitrosomonas oligotropha]|uniref:C2H2-type domain-containing protein n=2 Tax=Nitrosomonas TaxID=914 RepID=A0A5C7VW37_9PROT|nr:MAG: hypothetical protein E6Q60_07575 [Nitrosomonas oligotropha]
MTAHDKKRYYIHGDRYELDRYYCAECDVFFDESHFSHPHRENHYVRYAAAKGIKKLMKGSEEYFRPESSASFYL